MLPYLGQIKQRPVLAGGLGDSRPKQDFRWSRITRPRSLLPFIACLWGALISAGGSAAAGDSTALNFDRDIRPIFSDTCYACHGPDAAKRKADLRLDLRESAFAPREGGSAVVPGDPLQSGLYRRITSNDKNERMPPIDSGRQLSQEQISLIGRWIKQGAVWNEHWSLIPPKRSRVPHVTAPGWPQNAIDEFVLSRLAREGMSSSPPADKATLIRRVTLDLTGLPPTPDEVDTFENDPSPNAYEKIVDRLLASPRYGERRAIRWLDAARYADTNGYQTDGDRSMWRWRDWVIDAFNADIPFDQFTIAQIAGDMLPHATLEQEIASGFNRNHRGNAEGGIIPEEYLAEYVVDRVETTSTVWLGLTLGCARCHDHKYDPLRQKEFYQVFAYFNQVPERGRAIKVGNSPPLIKAPTVDDQRQLARLEARRLAAQQDFQRRARELGNLQTHWEQTADRKHVPADWGPTRDLVGLWTFDGNLQAAERSLPATKFVAGSPRFVSAPVGSGVEFDGRTFLNAGDVGKFGYFDSFSLAAWIRPAGPDAGTIVSRMIDADDGEGYSIAFQRGKLQVNLVQRWLDDAIRVETAEPIDCSTWHHVVVTYDGTREAKGIGIYVDGRPRTIHVHLDELNQTFDVKEPLRIGGGGGSAGRFHGALDEIRIYDHVLNPQDVLILATPDSLSAICAVPPAGRSPAQAAKLRSFFLENRAPAALREALASLRQIDEEIEHFARSFPTVMVMREINPPRETHVLIRGQYDHPGEKVSPGVPASLPPLASGLPNNRLGFARWLVDPANPLTSRVAVNREWQMFFGQGLVRTTEDFGSQGDRPSHPELLDWLATEFVRLGWDVKALDRLIVTSATYRQSSNATRRQIEQDPENRLLARGPRKRLSAEMIRDQALAASGLLVERVGGPSVRPYQPPGLWKDLNGQNYKADSGPGLYRRSLYTFWKRTIAPPAMVAFDAATREACTVRETRTNTPLQALNLLNDVTYIEASRKLAARVLETPASSPSERIARAFRLVLSRQPTKAEARILRASYDRRLTAFRADADSAKKLLAVGQSARDDCLDVAELAAYTTTASLIFNLAETVTKE
jgi:mono/diheme cytochrome c family protein